MILRGEAPPTPWWPYIAARDFSDTKLADITPLTGLTALQDLDLSHTKVSDISPLAHLTALESLNLWDTQVSDIAPLAQLTMLRTLDLSHTEIGDIAALYAISGLIVYVESRNRATALRATLAAKSRVRVKKFGE